jgi:hypothetical protein
MKVETAFRKLRLPFESSSRACQTGVPSGDVERALQLLEEAALRTINVFNAQQLTDTLHIMAGAGGAD